MPNATKPITSFTLEDILPFIDLTSLYDSDTEESVKALCQKALNLKTPVASLCVYPQFIELIKNNLTNNEIKICTVANFPAGSFDIDQTVRSIFNSMVKGADEIDVVLPYSMLLEKQSTLVEAFVKTCRQACGHKIILKIILETGALQSSENIALASKIAIQGGADFIKTSTGKIAVNATLEAANIMIHSIKESGKNVGFKASGGIKTLEQAKEYFLLAEKIMGSAWVTPSHFRIGTSGIF